MDIRYKIKTTEGMVYCALRDALRDVLKINRDYKDNTGNLRSSLAFQIYRNGVPVDDTIILSLKDKDMNNDVHYTAYIFKGIDLVARYEFDRNKYDNRK